MLDVGRLVRSGVGLRVWWLGWVSGGWALGLGSGVGYLVVRNFQKCKVSFLIFSFSIFSCFFVFGVRQSQAEESGKVGKRDDATQLRWNVSRKFVYIGSDDSHAQSSCFAQPIVWFECERKLHRTQSRYTANMVAERC